MKISVCIPAYNQGKYVGAAVESAFQQSRPPDEVIVSDDNSNDNTAEVLDAMAGKYPSLKVIHQPRNLGLSGNVNFCLKMASGDLVIRLDSDDLLLPRYIERLSQLMEENPQAGYAHANVQEINADGKVLGIRQLFRPENYWSAEKSLKEAVHGYKVAANILMFRKQALEDAGYITEQITFAEDFYLAIAIAASGWGNVHCKETLACYRVWGDEGNLRARRKLREIQGLCLIYNHQLPSVFATLNWDMHPIVRAREQMAISHMDCLQRSYYTAEEKNELKTALLELADSAGVKRSLWFFEHGLGGVVKVPAALKHLLKKIVKKVLVK